MLTMLSLLADFRDAYVRKSSWMQLRFSQMIVKHFLDLSTLELALAY